MDIERRIDRLDKIEDNVKEGLTLEREGLIRLTRLEVQVQHLTEAIKTFVNHSQFEPVRLIAYGLAAGVLISVLSAVLMGAIK